MKRWMFGAVVALALGTFAGRGLQAEEPAKVQLQGVWQAEAIESGGKVNMGEEARQMRFTFAGDVLRIKGNFRDEREEECTYKIDAKASPMQIEFTPPKVDRPIVGIFRFEGPKLQVCFRTDRGKGGRPTEFKTAAERELVMVTFVRTASRPWSRPGRPRWVTPEA